MSDNTGRKRSGAPGRVTEADYELLAAFRHTLRQFIHFSEAASQAAGLPPHQHQAMLIIRALSTHRGVTVGDIAERLIIRHQSAVGLVGRMVRRGVARKKTASKDRRRVFVTLTPKGTRLLKKLSALHKAELARLRPMLQSTLVKISSR